MNDLVAATAEASRAAQNRIASLIYETPLLPSRSIGAETGTNLYFKAENFQLTGSFKIRGATNKMAMMGKGSVAITASSGNHGIASCRAAMLTGAKLTVVLPETVAPAKLAKIRSYNAEVVLHGQEAGQAEAHALRLAEERGVPYISPYNDADIIAGQGTIGLELIRQLDHIDAVFISMGGGGLISGVGAVIKTLSPATRIYGVSARNSAALAASMVAGRVVEVPHSDTLADGVAGGVDEGSLTLAIASAVIDEVIHCSEDQIGAAVRAFALQEGQLVEGAAGLALAGFMQVSGKLQGQNVVVLTCGANFDPATILPLILAD